MTEEEIMEQLEKLQIENKTLKLELSNKEEELEKYKNMNQEIGDNLRYRMEVKHGIRKINGDSDLDKKIIELNFKGCGPYEMAAKCGVTYTTIWRHCRKLRGLGLLD